MKKTQVKFSRHSLHQATANRGISNQVRVRKPGHKRSPVPAMPKDSHFSVLATVTASTGRQKVSIAIKEYRLPQEVDVRKD